MTIHRLIEIIVYLILLIIAAFLFSYALCQRLEASPAPLPKRNKTSNNLDETNGIKHGWYIYSRWLVHLGPNGFYRAVGTCEHDTWQGNWYKEDNWIRVIETQDNTNRQCSWYVIISQLRNVK